MPARSRRGAQAARAAALVGLLLLVVFARTFEHSAFWHALQKLAHPVLFAAVAWLLVGGLVQRRELDGATWREYRTAAALAVALGALTEIAQHFVGRDPAWSDIARDAYGTLAGLLAFAARDASRRNRHRARRGLAGAAALLAIVACAPLIEAGAAYATRAWRFPTLATFSSPADLYFVARDNPRLAIVAVPAPWRSFAGETALDVPLRRGAVRAFKLVEPAPDWSAARTLVIELTNPDDSELELIVRVHDRAHDQTHADRYNAPLRLLPRTRHVERIPLARIEAAPRGRKLDLSRVAGLAIFEPADGPPRRFLLHGIRLE